MCAALRVYEMQSGFIGAEERRQRQRTGTSRGAAASELVAVGLGVPDLLRGLFCGSGNNENTETAMSHGSVRTARPAATACAAR